jgi:hypothetical protein
MNCLLICENIQETTFTGKKLYVLQERFCLEKKMGTGLGSGEILQ